MRDTNRMSAMTEGKVLSALVATGYCVSIPFGVARYDMLIDVPTMGIQRVQCKTASLTDDVVKFKTASVHKSPDGSFYSRSYALDADFFGVFCPDLDKVYVIPVMHHRVQMNLRLSPPKNGKEYWDANRFEVQCYYDDPLMWDVTTQITWQ